jgi:fatty-acyl-CoA synthase
MIISGGFNVYPREVEDVLSQHPAVAAAAVVGIPDAKWGEAVHAQVVLRVGASVAAEELMALVRERKGAVQAPKSIEFVAALPVTGLGKLDKKAIRAKFWQGQQRGCIEVLREQGEGRPERLRGLGLVLPSSVLPSSRPLLN